MHSCDVCKVHFTEASNLRRHKRTKHLNHERGHKCQFCDKEFARSDSLMKHRVAVHKVKLAFDRKRENAFACDQCDKAFGLRKNLLRHGRAAHSVVHKTTDLLTRREPEGDVSNSSSSCSNLTRLPSEVPKEHFQCRLCQRIYKLKKSLKKHFKKSHSGENEGEVGDHVDDSSREKASFKCAMCDYRGPSYINLTCHLTQQHDYEDDTEYKEFKSMEEFKAWKECVQGQQVVSFVNDRGVRQQGKGEKTLFECHRSGIFVSRGKGMRAKKKSCKVGAVCPARMDVLWKDDGTVSLTWHRNHFGHKFDMNFMRLTATEREITSTRLKNNESIDSILDDNCNEGTEVEKIDMWKPVCGNLKSCLDQLSGVIVSAEVVDQGIKFLELLQNEVQNSSNSIVSSSLPSVPVSGLRSKLIHTTF